MHWSNIFSDNRPNIYSSSESDSDSDDDDRSLSNKKGHKARQLQDSDNVRYTQSYSSTTHWHSMFKIILPSCHHVEYAGASEYSQVPL